MTVPTALPSQRCVLRILNGPLRGCEFVLGNGATLFVVGAVDALGEGALAASVPQEAFYIPFEEDGCNFEVLADQVAPDGVPLRLLGDPVEVRHCAFQDRVQVGALQIALRLDGEPWAAPLLGPLSAAPGTGFTWRAPWIRWGVCGLAVVAALAATGLGSLSTPAPEADVRALIAGASEPVQVLRGRDRAVYVFVSSERDAGWSRQVLARHGTADGKVLLLDQERRRLEQVLVEHDPHLAWHFLDLKDPSWPRLLLSAQRNLLTPDQQASLLETLLAAAPYAHDVVLQRQDDTLLAGLAQGGLQRLALAFDRIEHEGGVTFAVEGNLQDAELTAARQFVEGFYRQWGDRYVHFTVELKDDWLKGKSFQTGPQGYVKTSPSSWHFSNKQSR